MRPASEGYALKCKFWASCSCVVARVNAKRSVEVALDGFSQGFFDGPYMVFPGAGGGGRLGKDAGVYQGLPDGGR